MIRIFSRLMKVASTFIEAVTVTFRFRKDR